MTEAVVRTLIGLPHGESKAFLLKVFGDAFPFEKIARRMKFFRDAYFENWGLSLKRGTTELMEVLDDLNTKKAIISSSNRTLLDKWTLHSGLFVHFPVAVSEDDIFRGGNPDNKYFQAAEKLNVPPNLCIAVEHSDYGIRSAHAAGMTVILVPGLQQLSEQTMLHAYHLANIGEPDGRTCRKVGGHA